MRIGICNSPLPTSGPSQLRFALGAGLAVIGVVLSGCTSDGAAPPETGGSESLTPSLKASQAPESSPSAPAETATTAAGSGEFAPGDPADVAPIPGTGPTPPSREVLAPLSPDGGQPPVVDPCAVLRPAEVLALGSAPPTSENQGSSELSLSTCVWGTQGDESMLWMYIIRPGDVADPGALFIPQQAPPSQPAPQPPGGRVWESGFFGFGGTTVEGRTYMWSVGTDQVVLTYLGEVTPERAVALQQAVNDIDQALVAN
jgi:hypothetical protein